MKKRLVMVATAGLLALALLFVPTMASADQAAGAIAFSGIATTPALWTPVAPGCGAALCPGGSGAWSFGAATGGIPIGAGSTCAGAGVHGATPGGPACSIDASGTLGPGLGLVGAYCGFSSGSGDATIVIGASATKASVSWNPSAGSVLVLTGTVTEVDGAAHTGVAVSVVDAIPPNPVTNGILTPPTGVCSAGAGTIFRVVGVASAAAL